jgi:hypothetical protein
MRTAKNRLRQPAEASGSPLVAVRDKFDSVHCTGMPPVMRESATRTNDDYNPLLSNHDNKIEIDL